MVRISHARSRRRGGILLATLIFAVIIATILAGLGTLVVSYFSRVTTESEYASAINMADAGANYELRKINQNVNTADLAGTGSPPGTTVTFGAGSFRVYCTMADGVTTWDKSTIPFYILSSGKIGTASRTIKVKITDTPNSAGQAGLFAVVSGDTSTAHGVPTVQGSVATDGTLDFTGNPTVTGTIYFDGPGSGWNPTPGNTYSVVYNAAAVIWPTTLQVALTQFPNSGATAPGGMTYLSANNDNALSSPPISGNSVSLGGNSSMTFYGKAGGANYYVTSMTMKGNSTVTFNNTAGPITIWQGTPTGSLTISGGVAAISMSSDPTKAVRIYAAVTAGVTLSGNSELDAGVYNVTDGTATTTMNGTGTINGTVICDNFLLNGNDTINTTLGYFTAPGQATYKFNNSYIEVNGL